MKLNRYKIQVTSTNTYIREVVAENEDEAVNELMTSLSDNDKISENSYDVESVENLGDETKVYHD
jgi:hypothetical protein